MRSLRLIVVVLVLAVLLATAQAAAAAAPQTRIINGYLAAPGAWPAHVHLAIAGKSCGGTLVSLRWVLTAAHCATLSGAPAAPGGIQVRVGSNNRTSGGLLATVDQVVRHESFSDPAGGVPNFDLALLHLVQTPSVEPLPMVRSGAVDASLWSPGVTATVVGWGYTTQSNVNQPSTLREAQVPIVSDAGCASAWTTDFNAATMLCAGGSTIDTCPGDSGGPLMVPRLGGFVLAGITSWGSDPCGDPGFPGVYTRLGDPALNAWVKQRVPTVAFTASPAAPQAGQPVTFTAAPGPAGGVPAFTWDTDSDGVFDDAAGPSAAITFPGAGTYGIAVRADYADLGDRSAVTRDVVSVAAAPPSPPAPPPAPPPPPPPPPPPAADARTITNGVSVTARMTLLTLRTKGVRVRFRCERACTIRGRATLGPVSARRFGLGGRGKSVTIATGTARLLKAGSGTLTLKLTTRAKRALRNRPRATISVITELRAGSTQLPGKHRVSVRR